MSADDLRGRHGTFGTIIDVRGSLATTVDPWTPTVFYVAGVTLSAPEARYVWQAWHFRYLHRCPRKLGDDGGPMDADCLLRGRRGTFSSFGTFIDVRGSLATTVGPWTPTVFYVAGVTLSAPEARYVWQAWHFRYLHRCPRKLGDDGGPMDADCLRRGRRDTFGEERRDLRGRRGAFGAFIDVRGTLATTVDPWTPTVFDVAGVTLSAPEARFAWQAWHFRYLHRGPRKLGDDGGPMDADCLLRGRRDTFSTAGAICVAGVVL